MSPLRYSEQRLQDPFSVSLLFSEPFQFRVPDLVAALREEFPALGDWDHVAGDRVHDTSLPVVGFLSEVNFKPGKSVHFASLPGVLATDDGSRSAIDRAFAFRGAQEAWNAHRSHLTFTTQSEGRDLAARFRAARLVTCVSAVLAADPTCVGVMFPSGDVFAAPEAWREGAAEAIVNRWPLMTWFSYEINRFQPSKPGEQPGTSCGAVGMAAFNGHEVSFALAPVTPAYAVASVRCAMYLLLAGGNQFKDGDTVGVEGDDDERLRIRFRAEGSEARTTDSWVLIHPASSIDEMAIFGERERPPPPPGVDNEIRPQEDFMDRLLGNPTGQDPTLKH